MAISHYLFQNATAGAVGPSRTRSRMTNPLRLIGRGFVLPAWALHYSNRDGLYNSTRLRFPGRLKSSLQGLDSRATWNGFLIVTVTRGPDGESRSPWLSGPQVTVHPGRVTATQGLDSDRIRAGPGPAQFARVLRAGAAEPRPGRASDRFS